MKSTNLVLIESELQLRSFLNYYSQYSSDSEVYEIIVRLNGVSRNDSRILSTYNPNINKFKKATIFKCHRDNKLSLIKLIAYSFLTSLRFTSYKNVFVGDFRSKWMAFFYYLNHHKKRIFLDDGTATIEFYKDLQQGKIVIKKSFALATSFELKTTENIQVIPLKHSYKEKNTLQNSVLFIGMDLVEIGVISESEYISAIRNILQKYQSHDIEYIPHRLEVLNKLEGVLSDFNIKINQIDIAIENYLSMCEEVPAEIVSFYSTAIVNLPDLIKGPTYTSYKLNLKLINPKFRAGVANLYNYIKMKENLNLIE